MNPIIEINQRVSVVTIFRASTADINKCWPHKMHYHGKDVTFTIFGMRHPTSRGKRMIHVFEVSDGANDYRLEFDAEGLSWQLISIIEGHYA